MKFASMLRRLRNTQGGMRSTAGSASTPYDPYTDPPSDPFGVTAAASPQTVSVGTAVTFTGTVSNAPDGAVLSYLWDFSDKANPTAGGSGVRVSYTYPTPGVKTATLTVSYTDTNGDLVEVCDEVIINVFSADAGSDQIVCASTVVEFNGSVENAPEGVELSYSWDFGDAEAISLDNSGVMAACIYLTHGERTVTLTVSYTGTDNEKVEASDTLTVTVIHIKSREVEDGTENVKFKVLGAPSGAEFFWYSRYPEGAGNTPEVVFLRPNPREPNAIIIEKAKWFAWPNRACRTDEGEPAGRRSQYTIICNITFPDGRFFAAMADLIVVFSWELGGFIGIGYSGEPTMEENSATGLWEVTGRGNMERVIIPFTLPESSQFYPKVQAHEEVHVNQINTGIASSYYTVERLWANHLRGLTRESEVDLEIAVEEATDAFVDAENERIKPLVPQLERDAYEESDGIPPQYLFQRCDRFSNDDVDDC